MFCIAELMMLIVGLGMIIITLSNGRLPLSADKELRGWAPYTLGILLMLPMPVSLTVNFVVGAQQGLGQPLIPDEDSIIYELIILVAFLLPAILIAAIAGQPRRRKKPQRRRARPEYDDDDAYANTDDDRRRRRRYDDDDAYDDRPHRRRQRRNDDDY